MMMANMILMIPVTLLAMLMTTCMIMLAVTKAFMMMLTITLSPLICNNMGNDDDHDHDDNSHDYMIIMMTVMMMMMMMMMIMLMMMMMMMTTTTTTTTMMMMMMTDIDDNGVVVVGCPAVYLSMSFSLERLRQSVQDVIVEGALMHRCDHDHVNHDHNIIQGGSFYLRLGIFADPWSLLLTVSWFGLVTYG